MTEATQTPTQTETETSSSGAVFAQDDVIRGAQDALTEVPEVDRSALALIAQEIAIANGVVIFALDDDGTAHVAITDSGNINALNILRFVARQREEIAQVVLHDATEEIFSDIVRQYSSAQEAVHDVVRSFNSEEEELKKKSAARKKHKLTQESVQDAPVAKLVNVIIDHAIDGNASDIHIEPHGKEYRVRFRVDGVLHASLTFPVDVGRAVVSHIKILSNLKIDEKRKPQDGRFKVHRAGDKEEVDFRVSTLPVVDGEKVVIRVLRKDNKVFDPKELGLVGRNYDILMERIREPYGMILITGPTGSGKSTTLYGFLRILNEEQRNIITLEDPVEYHIDGVNQSQVRPEIGYTFANGLRSILRQDPNVLMVGEIRDGETAELAIHAALTGHLVFSTLHTNSAIGAIPRLIDMGIEPFLLAAALREVVAQRLVRRICESCKERVSVSPSIIERIREDIAQLPKEEIAKYGVNLNDGITLYHGAGCDACGNTGYKGRVAIYEVIGMDATIQSIITEKNGAASAVEQAALNGGMIVMRQDGLLKALLGITTLEEVMRLTEGSVSIGGDGSLDD